MKKSLLLAALFSAVTSTTAMASTLTVFIDSFWADFENSFTLTTDPATTTIASQGVGSLAYASPNVFTYDLSAGDYIFTIRDSFGDGVDSGRGFTLTLDGVVIDNCGNCSFSSRTTNFTVAAVPLPATGLLMFGALGAFAAFRRKTR